MSEDVTMCTVKRVDYDDLIAMTADAFHEVDVLSWKLGEVKVEYNQETNERERETICVIPDMNYDTIIT